MSPRKFAKLLFFHPKGNLIFFLKMLHLFATTMWAGGAISLIIVLGLCPSDTPEALYFKAQTLRIIDHFVIGPGVLGSVGTAILYGTSTHFGFVKYPWIKIKWILTIVLVTFAILTLLPMIGHYKDLAKELLSAEQPDRIKELYVSLGQCSICIMILSIFQISILASHTIISVYRPWRFLRRK